MYIPRPAKLLFTIDNGWNKFLEKHGDSISSRTRLSVKMVAYGDHLDGKYNKYRDGGEFSSEEISWWTEGLAEYIFYGEKINMQTRL